MMHSLARIGWLALLWKMLLPMSGFAQAPPNPTEPMFALRVGQILPVSGEPIRDGVLLVQGGKILAVGPFASVQLPATVAVRHLPDAVMIPGLVDTHSHLGVYSRPGIAANSDGNEMSGPVQSGIRALDALYPDDPGIRMALAGGITTANVMPGSGNVIGGQTIYVKLRGATVEAMAIVDPRTVGGLKMANGENPKGYGRTKSQAPFTRMKVAAMQREQFIRAREYAQRWTKHREELAAGMKTTPPDRDLDLEPLVEVLERKRTVHFHCHRADDLLTAMRIAEEFQFDLVLQHATEAYRVVDELVRRKQPVSLTLLDSPGGKAEAVGLLAENAAILEKAGVAVSVNTDDPVTESRFLLRTTSLAVRGGMTEAGALRSITLNPAKLMRLDHRIGSLEPGKDADFVLLNGSPFSIYSAVLETYIDGKKVFDASQKRDWAYRVGGFALSSLDRLPGPFPPVKPLEKVDAPAMARLQDGEQKEFVGGTFAVLAGRIHTAAGEPIRDGVILVENGKIAQIGPRAKIVIPKEMPVVTAAEVTPGLIDTHSVVGLSGAYNSPADQDQDERSGPIQPALRVLDSFNPNEPLLDFLRSEGVTVIHAMPGPVNVIAGQTGVFRTAGRTPEKMAIRFPAGLLVNLGENSKGAYAGRMPLTRMGVTHLLRKQLTEAQAYRAKKQAAEPGKPVARNLDHEALEPVLEGKVPVFVSANRVDDILSAMRIAREFQIPMALASGTEAFLVADAIAEAKIPVVLHPTMQRAGSTMETLHSYLGNAKVLTDRKIPVSIGTSYEGYVPKTRVLRSEMAMAIVGGLSPDAALRTVTIDAARILNISEQYGSLEVGKVADLVLYDGDPFENATHVQMTIVAGKPVFNRAEYLKLPFERRMLPAISNGIGCCMGW
ncbi:amidohydrolase family protein [Tuwongella immobilis]|uniref:Amidohydrolase-related domain-containing protein n=1 Tax=Tuwongella immobilis TaxID=692036 RepID=A0A6C2YLZ9_9BACT|nr:amidohydrolase family protein [Tuwongella immobilis]VIP02341.1 amidohydrolase : Amidohydrolase, imidazolonepropionase OS=Singulisphaera acidiphila (strain ATCC BAA-1392 / DSM 18658 / VKM B-2454 / MOB10) GN=Sinac_7119 PE=4 SV=1: Amidohydro_4: Amidohydro_4 [Tuwongella immobilis]VTS01109.1 amidohydrolase : Amidohydrolase, imidazolonepropionase OS=Singulisphaera acidiphila (strain ATCC BAA-1392 / DSM 18658 / VKM B-2454 / MOB10) GN=Sinac_7119 PE=4 SV=1: Amidohydro_4: Amidohydro_4 [Tuwongella immobi